MPKVNYTDQNADSLERIADAWDELTNQIRAMATTMRVHDLGTIPIGNATAQRRSLDDGATYVAAVLRAVNTAKAEKGHFIAGGDTVADLGDTAGQKRAKKDTKSQNRGHGSTTTSRPNPSSSQ